MPMAKIASIGKISRGHGGKRHSIRGSTAKKAKQLHEVKTRALSRKKSARHKKGRKGKKKGAKVALPGYGPGGV